MLRRSSKAGPPAFKLLLFIACFITSSHADGPKSGLYTLKFVGSNRAACTGEELYMGFKSAECSTYDVGPFGLTSKSPLEQKLWNLTRLANGNYGILNYRKGYISMTPDRAAVCTGQLRPNKVSTTSTKQCTDSATTLGRRPMSVSNYYDWKLLKVEGKTGVYRIMATDRVSGCNRYLGMKSSCSVKKLYLLKSDGGAAQWQITTAKLPPEPNVAVCWGQADSSQLGIGAPPGTTVNIPSAVKGEHVFTTIFAGGVHAGGIDQNKKLWMWGKNDLGQVGDGTKTLRTIPVAIGDDSWVSCSAGKGHTCCVQANTYALFCWGSNVYGQLGQDYVNATDVITSPLQVGDYDFKVASVTAGGFHTCVVLKDTREALCFGRNGEGQAGVGDIAITEVLNPSPIDAEKTWVKVWAGRDHTCGIENVTRLAYCWGSNDESQQGSDPIAPYQASPVAVKGSRKWKSLCTGLFHTCGLEYGTNYLYCWGFNESGQCGIDNSGTNEVTEPTKVDGSRTYKAVTCGGYHTCAVDASNKLYCWGENENYQLGSQLPGDTADQESPQKVREPAGAMRGAVWTAVAGGEQFSCGLYYEGGEYIFV